MSLFAKDLDYLDVLAADFLPDGDKLYIVVADSDCNLHILQYDPEGEPPNSIDKLYLPRKPLTNFKTLNPPTATASSTAANSTPDHSPQQ